MKITKQQLDSIIKEELEAVVAERCWDGYERVPNKREGEQGSCRKQGSVSEEVIDEKKKKKKKKKKAKKKDACYHKVKSRYDVWPSAYASGALVKCRKVGAKNWGKSTTKEELELYEGKESLEAKIRDVLIKEGGAAGMKALKEQTGAPEKEIKDAIKGMKDVGLHKDGDYILQDKIQIHVKKKVDENLRDWFGKSKSKDGKAGWVDVVDGDACAREKGETATPKCVSSAKRASMTPKERKASQAKKRREDPNQPKKSGAAAPTNVKTDKKTKKESLEMKKQTLMGMIKEELDAVRDTYGSEVSDRNKQSIKDGSKDLGLTEGDYHYVDAADINEEYCPHCAKQMEEAKKKKACKPSKGKRFAKRVDGKCRSFGQAGKAKSGGDRIRPGTKKGDAYCARSAGIKKCKNPPCANTLSRKKWKCRGKKSMKS